MLVYLKAVVFKLGFLRNIGENLGVWYVCNYIYRLFIIILNCEYKVIFKSK
jgi:hypothetical protein